MTTSDPQRSEQMNEEQTDTLDTPPAENIDDATEASLGEELIKIREAALRTAAEYDNYRKRMVREKEDIIRYANQRLLEELLPALDNFEMGMMAAKADSSSMIYIGMSMVQKQLEEFLTQQGVTEILAENQIFDHNIHDAVGTKIVDTSIPEGKILRVARRGYKLRDRLLRPASVVVAHHATDDNEPLADA